MSSSTTDKMNLLSILSRATDLSEGTILDFDVVTANCDMALSSDAPLVPEKNSPSHIVKKKQKGEKTSTTKAKKRVRKKAKDMPRRPLSAYNLFFQYEREQILLSRAAAEGDNTEETLKMIRNVSVGAGGRKLRSHRKSHGKIGFVALAKIVSQKWKSIDDATKSAFEARAMEEKERYKAGMDKWHKEQKIKKQKIAESAFEAGMKEHYKAEMDKCDEEQKKKKQTLKTAAMKAGMAQEAEPWTNNTTVPQALSVSHSLTFQMEKGHSPVLPAATNVLGVSDHSKTRTGNIHLNSTSFQQYGISDNKMNSFEQTQQHPRPEDDLLCINPITYTPQHSSVQQGSTVQVIDNSYSQGCMYYPDSTKQQIDEFDMALDWFA